ncbi:general substrate transporter [Aspergillus pseudoustus]|uniref:General substrate transporter n=1 Tax=Aspergillus pseudoustus TaxID=1810923 RepID=A0ABR4J3Z9_9EURO
MAASDSPALTRPPKGTFRLAGRLFPRVSWFKDPNIRLLNFYIFCLITTNIANGFDGSMMNGLQSLVYWQDYFNHPSGSLLGLFSGIMSVGSLVALPLVPPLIDTFGRRSGIIIGSLFMILGTGLQAGATNFSMFIAARFFLGFGDVIAVTTGPLLIAEIAHPQHRALLVTFHAICYHLGAFIAAWVTYGTLKIESNWAWRTPSLLQGTFNVLILAVILFIPESPRYYISKDQPEKALRLLAHYHGNGNQNDEVVQLEFNEITTSIALDKDAANKSSWLDFLRTPGNRKRLAILVAVGVFSQWSGNGLISYYLNIILDNIGITNPNTQLLINGAITTFNLVTNTFFGFFVDRVGRRPIYLVSTGGTLVAFVIWTIISARYSVAPQDGLGIGVVVMIFVYNFFYNVKSGLLGSYSTEILPYGLRAKGFTLLYICLYAALFFNQYVNPVALDNISWKYYIFYCCFLAFELVFVWYFIVETRYTPLEEISKLFDGDDVVELANLELKKKDVEHVEGAEAREIPVA